MTTEIKTSKNGNFKLMVENIDDKSSYFVTQTSYQRIGVRVNTYSLTGGKKRFSIDASLNTDNPGEIREMASCMLEAADFVDEINAIVNA